jgi:hypothetical protein
MRSQVCSDLGNGQSSYILLNAILRASVLNGRGRTGVCQAEVSRAGPRRPFRPVVQILPFLDLFQERLVLANHHTLPRQFAAMPLSCTSQTESKVAQRLSRNFARGRPSGQVYRGRWSTPSRLGTRSPCRFPRAVSARDSQYQPSFRIQFEGPTVSRPPLITGGATRVWASF